MANVNIRVDDTLKRDTEVVLSELGLSLSAATTLFYKQVVRYGGIPLDLRIDRDTDSKENKYESLSKYFGIAKGGSFQKSDKEILAERLVEKYDSLT